MIKTNLFVIANAKQLQADGSFRILLSFSQYLLALSYKFNCFKSFYNRGEFAKIFVGLRNLGVVGLWTPKPPTPLGTPMLRRHPYFHLVVGLARSCDPESYACGRFLLVGSHMPDIWKLITQTKWDDLPSSLEDSNG